MKHRLGPLAGSLVCAAFLAVACGGSSFESAGGRAGSSGGGESAAGAQANGGEVGAGAASGETSGAGTSSAGTSSGGTSSGGTSSAGTSSAGTSSAGEANGGASNGGATNGGASSAGMSNGGSGGNPLECNEDTDCTACAYPTAPRTAEDCYCASCAGAPLSKTACSANQAAWTKQCAATHLICAGVACIIPPVPQCKSHVCVAK